MSDPAGGRPEHDTAAHGQADARGRAYGGGPITVFYDARRCIHFAECVRGLSEVFDVERKPWIDVSGAGAERIAEVVRRCPTGALQYERSAGPPEAPDRPTSVTAIPDGPLTLRGQLSIETPAGAVNDTRAALCRCGLTENQPFCDHECKRAGWRSSA
jgi:uncharacterized Fe-S cluster protein YjdI